MSGLAPQLFAHEQKTYITDVEVRKNSEAANAWDMREDFLRMKPDFEAGLLFLNKWGSWKNWRRYAEFSEMIRLQDAVRGALLSPAKWFATLYAFPMMAPARSTKYPYYTFLTDTIEMAIRMTTTIDLLQKQKFKMCARPDCGMPFQVDSKHEKFYCKQYCGHLESVRRNRKLKEAKVNS